MCVGRAIKSLDFTLRFVISCCWSTSLSKSILIWVAKSYCLILQMSNFYKWNERVLVICDRIACVEPADRKIYDHAYWGCMR